MTYRKLYTYECVGCRAIFRTEKSTQAGMKCPDCGWNMIFSNPEKIAIPTSQRKVRSAGRLTVDVDVSDALTGLNAVQREARKTIQVLKELEELQKRTSDYADEDLPTRPEMSG